MLERTVRLRAMGVGSASAAACEFVWAGRPVRPRAERQWCSGPPAAARRSAAACLALLRCPAPARVGPDTDAVPQRVGPPTGAAARQGRGTRTRPTPRPATLASTLPQTHPPLPSPVIGRLFRRPLLLRPRQHDLDPALRRGRRRPSVCQNQPRFHDGRGPALRARGLGFFKLW
jgi:hypothetical protein